MVTKINIYDLFKVLEYYESKGIVYLDIQAVTELNTLKITPSVFEEIEPSIENIP